MARNFPRKKLHKTPKPKPAAACAPRKPKPRRPGPPPVRTSDQPGERLQKVLAAAGVASRRECEELISEGRVMIDGQVVTQLGVRVEPDKQKILLDGEVLRQPRRVYFALNKPTGVVCTARDPAGRPRVTDLLPPNLGRLFSVGRLDMSSDGLILMTNDGELAQKLAHPRHGVEKVYHVQVAGEMTSDMLEQLRKGIYLAEGKAHFAGARIKSARKTSTQLEVVLDEGRNREIRRLLARVGHKVQRLTRIAIGPVKLGMLPVGAHRELTPQEVAKLREGGPPRTKKPERPRADRPAGKAVGAREAREAEQAELTRPKRRPTGAARPPRTEGRGGKPFGKPGGGKPSGRPSGGKPTGGRPTGGKPSGGKPGGRPPGKPPKRPSRRPPG
jgi:23S rRNA pseudouridine2605 synthase